VGFTLWILYLLAACVLPEKWLYQPSLHALDALLWPIVRAFGRPAAVAIIGAGLASLAALTQAIVGDNARVREARRRARHLTSEADALPLNSRRRSALLSVIAAVHLRMMGTGLISVGILLGVFVLSFTWLVSRMDRSNPMPGSAARVVATIDADFRGPVTVEVNSPLRLDESSLPTRSLLPIRETLQRLASQQQMSAADLDDLKRFLRRGVPAQTLNWVVRSDVPGSFPVTLTFGKAQSIRQMVVFGDDFAPPDSQRIGDTRFPKGLIQVENTARKVVFWSLPLLGKTQPLAVSWPWIYLVAYLSAWLLGRRLLRLV
jgi:hypothetical protein